MSTSRTGYEEDMCITKAVNLGLCPMSVVSTKKSSFSSGKIREKKGEGRVSLDTLP